MIVIGPGLGTDRIAEKILKYVICKSEVPLVVDADGLNILAGNMEWLQETKVPVVTTPHIQEMARLTGYTKEQIKKRMIETANDFAAEHQAVLVMKDARTIVAKAGEEIYLNISGNSGMATGGSGDVLAGIIGGLIAQGMDALEASRLGVYVHGKAGDAAAARLGEYSMTATDILKSIAEVTRE